MKSDGKQVLTRVIYGASDHVVMDKYLRFLGIYKDKICIVSEIKYRTTNDWYISNGREYAVVLEYTNDGA